MNEDDDDLQPVRRRGLRTGYTTGACATAAALAATRCLLSGGQVDSVTIRLPAGVDATFQISACQPVGEKIRCSVIKDAGDDPDVTHGAEIVATVWKSPTPGIVLRGGNGVGTVTLPGLGLDVGGPAINPVPRRMILEAVTTEAESQSAESGLVVEISVPRGEELAKKTLNGRLGILGGISILGTTGIVRPYSTASWRASVEQAIDVAAANGQREIAITTGGRSERFAQRVLNLPDVALIEMGEFTGHALKRAVRRGIPQVHVCGMIGKLSKIAQGHLMTHVAGNQVDISYLASLAAKSGADEEVEHRMAAAHTAREVQEIAQAERLSGLFKSVAEQVVASCSSYVARAISIDCLLFDFDGALPGQGFDRATRGIAIMTQAGEAPSIDVIGVDDSGPGCLTDRERSLVHCADLLCGGDRHLALFPSCRADRFRIGADLEALYARLAKCGPGPAVVLASGDPCYFGIGPLLVSRFGAEHVKIHPRPSSVAMAFSRLGLPWQDATVLSVHGRPIEDAVLPALGSTKVAILTDPVHTPSEVAASLLASGMDDCPAFVCERLGGPDERIHSHSLSGLPDKEFDPLNVLILLPSGLGSSRVGIGRPDSCFLSARGQITKSEVRAVTVSLLKPWRAAVCWDVGAGCGSVSIETASLMRDPCVYAVEREPEQANLIRHNARTHRAAGIQIIEGSAPAALESLPAPDCVFVGGGGPLLMPILQLVSERLTAGGRIVANFALIERLAVWQQFAALSGWQSELSQIAVSRGEPLGGGTHLAPLAPVFVTRVTKPERDR